MCDPAIGTLPPEILFTNVVVTKVESLEKTAHVESIDPINADMAQLDCYVPMLFVYRLEEYSDAVYFQAVNQMKEGLQKVLVAFFPWAGRWVATPGGMQRQLLCNDRGIPFIEAFVDKDMDAVVKVSAEFQPVPELQAWEASCPLSQVSGHWNGFPSYSRCFFFRCMCNSLVKKPTAGGSS